MEYLHKVELLHLYSWSLHLNNQSAGGIEDQTEETLIQFYYSHAAVASIEATKEYEVATIISVAACLYVTICKNPPCLHANFGLFLRFEIS